MRNSYLSICDTNLSRAWLKTLRSLALPARREAIPLIVRITAFDDGRPREEPSIRQALDLALLAAAKPSVSTVANTIFPATLWNDQQTDQRRAADRLFERYLAILPRISRHLANRNGIYFARMIASAPLGSATQPVNQLRHVIETYRAGNHRRSALQLAILDPTRDHTNQRQRGFPCLHQVALTPYRGDRLAITAFYGTQYLFSRAYGNYLGLARLGRFLATQLELRLTKLTCIASVGTLGASKDTVLQLLTSLQDLDATTHN